MSMDALNGMVNGSVLDVIISWDQEWREGSRFKATKIAKDFCEANKANFEILDYMTVEGLVRLVERYREVGRHADRMIVEMWLVYKNEAGKVKAPRSRHWVESNAAKFSGPMHPIIQDFVREWRVGSRERARSLAEEYVRNYTEHFDAVRSIPLEDIVEITESLRDSGFTKECILAEMWALYTFEPQNISAEMDIGVSTFLRNVNRARSSP